MECPTCNGRKELFAFVNRGDKPHYSGYVVCQVCKGSGVITDEKMGRMIAGKAAREARVARGETLRQAAVRKNTTASEISRFERGENNA